MMYSNVTIGITRSRCLFAFSLVFKVCENVTDGSLAVGAFDLSVHYSLSLVELRWVCPCLESWPANVVM